MPTDPYPESTKMLKAQDTGQPSPALSDECADQAHASCTGCGCVHHFGGLPGVSSDADRPVSALVVADLTTGELAALVRVASTELASRFGETRSERGPGLGGLGARA